MRIPLCFAALALASMVACSTVAVTKTGKGFHEPTKADDIEILMTVPTRPFEELGVVSTQYWTGGADAKMHNALRAKTAPLGANAVIIRDSGIDRGYYWMNGVAIRYK